MTKWKQLQKTYKRNKDHNNKSGNDPAPTWKFYAEMDNLLGAKPSVKPVFTLSSTGLSTGDENCGTSSSVSHYMNCSEDTDPNSSMKRKCNSVDNSGSQKKANVSQQLTDIRADRQRHHEENVAMKHKMLDLMTKYMEDKDPTGN